MGPLGPIAVELEHATGRKTWFFVRFSLYLGPKASYEDGNGLNRFSVEKYMKHDTPHDEEISPYIHPETTYLMAKENASFTHEELIEITNSTLKELLASDSLLSYLPPDVSAEEVSAELALQHGQSMSLILHKENGQTWNVVVHKGAKVIDLKHAVKRCASQQLARHGEKRKISWRYVWKNNHLMFDHQPLDDDQTPLSQFGITNKSDLYFIKRRRPKTTRRK